MNTIGIDHNLDRARIRKLLAIGLFAAILTGIGDFVLGYGHAENMEGCGLAASVLASAPNLADWQIERPAFCFTVLACLPICCLLYSGFR